MGSSSFEPNAVHPDAGLRELVVGTGASTETLALTRWSSRKYSKGHAAAGRWLTGDATALGNRHLTILQAKRVEQGQFVDGSGRLNGLT